MAAGRFIVGPYFPARDRDGVLQAGALLYVFENGTTTKATIYTDEAMTVLSANPAVANSSGQFPAVWGEAGTADIPVPYTVMVTASDGASLGNPSTFDDFYPSLNWENAATTLAEAAATAADASADAAAASAAEAAADLVSIEEIAAEAPDAPSILNKANKNGDNLSAEDAEAFGEVLGIRDSLFPRGVILGRTVGFLGDSITNGSSASTSELAFTRQSIEMSGTAIIAPEMTGGSVISGHPGATSTAIKAFLPALLDTGVEIVVLEQGVNDVAQSVPIATFAANMLEQFEQVIAAGRSLYVMTIPPRGSASSPTAAMLKNVDAFNMWLRLVVPQYGQLIDINAEMVDPTTQYMLAAYDSGDGVHPNSTGHRLMAKLLADKWRTFQRPNMLTVINANNLVANPFFISSSSPWYEQPGGTGTAPSYSRVADTEGQLANGLWYEMDFAPGAGAGVRIMATNLAASGPSTWQVGDVVAVSIQVQIEDVAGNWETIGPGGTGTGGINVWIMNSALPLTNSVITGRMYPLGGDVYSIGPTWLTYTTTIDPGPPSFWVRVSLPAGAHLKVRIGEVGVINLTKTGIAALPLA